MNANQFLAILKARWWVAAAVLLLTVVTTIVVSLLLPKRYSATSTLVVDVKSPDPIAGIVFPALQLPSYIATQVDIILSDRVAQRAVRSLKLAENPEVRANWMEATGGTGSIEAWIAGTLRHGLEARPAKESSVINVSYTGQDPRFVAAVVNAFVQAFLDTSVELRADPARQYSSFFDERAKQLRDQVEAAQAKLSTFQREHGLVVNDERLDVETQRLNELSSQLVQLQAQSADSESRTRQARGVNSDAMMEVLSNPVVGTLKTELSRAEARLQELNSRLGANHPQVIEARANIAELRSRMNAEIHRVTGSMDIANKINRSREADIRATLEAQRAKVLKLKAQRDEAAVLQRDAENAQRSYDNVLVRRAQSSLESQANQTNIGVLSSAVPPATPSGPKVLLNTLLSIAVGALLAIGAAVLVELIDRRVRTLNDVGDTLGLPLLGVLPGAAPRRKLFAQRRTPLLQQRILGQLPHPGRGG
ncbi:MAG TPA: chain length determinant protein EpsF [Burkholderiaceae bacterium]|nr:chain length determinant protein EpsF [Burkholderiaceae bacterium]